MGQFSDPHLITTVSIANNSLKKDSSHVPCSRPCAKCLEVSCNLTSLKSLAPRSLSPG